MSSHKRSIFSQIHDTVQHRIERQIVFIISDKVGHQFGGRGWIRAWGQLRDKVWDQVYQDVRLKIYNEIDKEIDKEK